MNDPARSVRRHLGAEAWDLAVVLGSGLGEVATGFGPVTAVDYADVPGFPRQQVAGHRGRLVSAQVAGRSVLFFQGRFHLYQGFSARRICCTVDLVAELGVPRLLLTNAAGGIRSDLAPGDFLWVTDHLNLTGANPLQGLAHANPFLDAGALYRADLAAPLRQRLRAADVVLREGVLAGLTGPSYETPAEIRMLERLGADAVSMSTVNEALWARWRGLDTAAVSLIANPAAGLGAEPLRHADVLLRAQAGAARFGRLLESLVPLWCEARTERL